MNRKVRRAFGAYGGGVTGLILGIEAATGVVENMLPDAPNLAKLAVFGGLAVLGAVGGVFAGLSVSSD